MQAGARLCKALGPEFLPYLPVVMPPLLAAARLEPEMKVHDPEGEDYEDDDDVEHIQLGDKVGFRVGGLLGFRVQVLGFVLQGLGQVVIGAVHVCLCITFKLFSRFSA